MAGKKRRVPPENPPDGAPHKKKVASSSSHLPEAEESASHALPVHSNRGGGGPAKRVEAFDKATDISKRKKVTGFEIPCQNRSIQWLHQREKGLAAKQRYDVLHREKEKQ